MKSPDPLRRALPIAATLVAYVLAGQLGLALAIVHPSASPIWAPTGIAIAALLLAGPRVFPAIFLGAFAVNWANSGLSFSTPAIAVGNAVEAWIEVTLVQRFAGGRETFARPLHVALFATFAALAAGFGATVGTSALTFTDQTVGASYVTIWSTWWLGDLCGALLVAPPIVLWFTESRTRIPRATNLELCAFAATLFVVEAIVFGFFGSNAGGGYPIQFLCVPLFLWAAFRFRARVASTAALLLAIVAVHSTANGIGPFVLVSPNSALLLVQCYMGTLMVTMLVVAANAQQRRVAEDRAHALNARLESLVAERTAELAVSTQEVETESQQRTLAQAELERSERRLNEAQRVAHVGSWEWNVTGDQLWWSDELYRIYGVDPATFERSYASFLERVHPEDRAAVDAEIQRAFVHAKPFSFEHRILRSDGEVRMLYARGQVLADAAGEPSAVVGIAQDVTELKQAQTQREQLVREQAARREAEDANRLKDQFLAVLSHELRTPLNAIVGWAHLLRDGKLDAEARERAIETILRNARLQTQLISDILDVSRIMSGRITLQRRSVDLQNVVEVVADTLRPELEQREVVMSVRADALPPIAGDPARLQQVLANIVSNAIRFARSPGGRVEVALRARDGAVEIEVRDDGPGIPASFLPYVFDRFRQADSTTTRRHGGLGLGLAIVRNLVELHGGSVKAGNRSDGSGAVITVVLPMSDDLSGAAAPDRASPDVLPSAPLADVRVLVVDDEPDGRDAAARMLQKCGATTATAGSVNEAVERLLEETPDVVLCDIGMPVQDGFALLRRIRALPGARARIPVAALTAYASQEDRQRVLEAGFQAHVVKPVRPADLVQTVMELARRVRAAASNSRGSSAEHDDARLV